MREIYKAAGVGGDGVNLLEMTGYAGAVLYYLALFSCRKSIIFRQRSWG